MQIRFLGTGTSSGVPVLGCSCAVCQSKDPRDQRSRPSIAITSKSDGGTKTIVVDIGADFRRQILSAAPLSVDAVLITHTHADHVHGIDDLRPLTRPDKPMPLFAETPTLNDLRRRFDYIFNAKKWPGSSADLVAHSVEPGQDFALFGLQVQPVRVMHGRMPVTGFIFRQNNSRVAYLTDCNHLPDQTVAAARGVDILILDALRFQPHPTHFSVDQAIAVAKEIAAKKTYFTHLCHQVAHRDLEAYLDAPFAVAYDGLELGLAT